MEMILLDELYKIKQPGIYTRNLIHLLQMSPLDIQGEIVGETIRMMDNEIAELIERLIFAKSRALPDDYLNGKYRITYSFEEIK